MSTPEPKMVDEDVQGPGKAEKTSKTLKGP